MTAIVMGRLSAKSTRSRMSTPRISAIPKLISSSWDVKIMMSGTPTAAPRSVFWSVFGFGIA